MAPSPYFTGPLHTRMAEGLHLGGMSERTHDGYLRADRKLADFCQTSPDKCGVAYRCDDCGRSHWFGRGCGNRHCPGCGAEKTSAWLTEQAKRLMPVHYFLVTFTVPDRISSAPRGSTTRFPPRPGGGSSS